MRAYISPKLWPRSRLVSGLTVRPTTIKYTTSRPQPAYTSQLNRDGFMTSHPAPLHHQSELSVVYIDRVTEPVDRVKIRETRLLDAATRLFARFGFDKTSVDDIARAAGVSKGAVYLHWPSKFSL